MEYVIIKKENRIFEIILNRPDKRNALNSVFVDELKSAFTQAALDSETKVVLLTARGESFCTGADLGYLRQLQNNSYEENLEDSTSLKELFQLIYSHPKCTIALVDGHAYAGGCGLATVCDFVFATPASNFAYTEVKIGFIPAIVMYFLLRKISEAQARQLLLTGNFFTAEYMKNLGLVYAIEPKEKIKDEVMKFCNHMLTQTSATAVTITKKMIAEIQSMSVGEGLQYAAEMNAHARATADCKAGISAFLNKEKKVW